MVASKIREQDEILRKKLHISYIDQFVVPPIFNYLIGAKNVEIRPVCTFVRLDWNSQKQNLAMVPAASVRAPPATVFAFFHSASMEIHRIAHRRTGCESTHKSAYFSYSYITFGTINTRIS